MNEHTINLESNNSIHLSKMIVSNITRSFGNGRGIYNASFNLESKIILGIIGANASGKSTLMRCATLFDSIDHGTIRINGEVVAGISHSLPKQTQKRKLQKGIMGSVFQDSRPWPHLSVWENVTLPLLHSAGFSNTQASEMAMHTLEQFGLDERINSYPWQLSGGLRQRVVLARSLALRPQIIAIDEGTSALDPEWTERVRVIIRDYANSGAAILLISHQMGFMKRLADQVLFLHRGQIHEKGLPTEIFNNPKTQELQEFLKNA